MKDKWLDRIGAALVTGLTVLTLIAAHYDHANAQALVNLDKGTYTEMRRVHITSDAAARVFPDIQNLQDSNCTPVGGLVWLGTHTASAGSVSHPNILNGNPVFASGTITLNGSFRGGTLYATGDIGQSTISLRCTDWLTR